MSLPVLNSAVPMASGRELETQVPRLWAVTVVAPTLATIFVAMRIYTRVFLVRKYFLEDYSIVVSMVCSSIALVVKALADVLTHSTRFVAR